MGKSKNPGRLNDLRHIIYKGELPLETVKKKFGTDVKEGLLKENIDGEAITWAFNRLKKEKRKEKFLWLFQMVLQLMTQLYQ